MAEAIINHKMGETWQAFSAGTKPSGYIHPKALQALEEIGIHHQGESKPTNQLKGIDFALVITVCDSAAEDCPLWLGSGEIIHHSFPDPAKATGTDDEIMAVFRQVRDDIAEQMPVLLESLQQSHKNIVLVS